MAWWLRGGVTTLLLALPIIVLVTKDGLHSAMPMAGMSIVLGTLMGAAGHFLLKVM